MRGGVQLPKRTSPSKGRGLTAPSLLQGVLGAPKRSFHLKREPAEGGQAAPKARQVFGFVFWEGDMKINFFKISEFECKCGCGNSDVSEGLIVRLELLRRILGRPIVITSGRRCVRHNGDVGGSPVSRHMYGRACDVRWDGSKEFLGAFRAAFGDPHCECIAGAGYIHVALPVEEATSIMWDGNAIRGA